MASDRQGDAGTGYGKPGPFTTFPPMQIALTGGVPVDPVDICATVRGLIVQPDDAAELGVPPERIAEKNIRPVRELIDALVALDPAPLHKARAPASRVVGTCRHFATLGCALLRLRGIPARARCGFASYFLPGKNVDHWIIEYWRCDQRRWARVDSEVVGTSLVHNPADLAEGEFLTGGEAWQRYRSGAVDGQSFGVAGVDFARGPAEIRGNAIGDLAALNKVETLPWDEWGRMTASYRGETGAGYDELIDRVATVCAGDDDTEIRRLYADAELAVPAAMIG